MNPIVVLGSQVVDGQVTDLLASRLDKAIEVSARHPDSPVVVSGFGEAAPMADYLRSHGVANIVEEPWATSTNENLENAHALFPDTLRWIVVTSGFHAWRTYLWAWHLGIPIKVVTASTPANKRLGMALRECVALSHSALRVLWRKLRTPHN
ncbi:hypothetical protein N24_0845 [Corynebacterium suranareeae]|uniref:DUF218 domain-containing protein n=1 Tax=Corynebacterium suranareeae TaxID=2506452 RepID=A0A160PMP6_9CORY|nr:YdcF family protein [Corynebacterium suranareeae]BAU95107.1 hypothetical protein N24_0845 [Corynebacterium suranareeae]